MTRIKKQYDRLSILLKQEQRIFHTQDLAVLWGISNKNTLYRTINRYINKGVLYSLYKGLYSTLLPDQLNVQQLALKAIHGYGYLSCETVLSQEGLINQLSEDVNVVSHQSRRLLLNNTRVRTRQLTDKFLYHPAGIQEKNGVRIATPERAIADMLYLNPRFSFDAPVNWRAVQELQQEIGYPLTPQRYAYSSNGRHNP